MPQLVKIAARSRLQSSRAASVLSCRCLGRVLNTSLPRFLKSCLVLSALIALTACNLTQSSPGAAALKAAAVGKPAPKAAPKPSPAKTVAARPASAPAPQAAPAAPQAVVLEPTGMSLEFVTPEALMTTDEMARPGLIDRAVYMVGLGGELFTGRAGQDFLRDHGLTSDFVLTGAVMPAPPLLTDAAAAPAPSAGTPEAAVIVSAMNTAPSGKKAAKKAAAGSSRTESLLMNAYGQTGRHYKTGGQDPQTGFDAPGFARWVYAQSGFSLPRNMQTQISGGQAVARGELRPGDLLAYRLPGGEAGGYHVGIYTGHGNFLHADAGTGVVTETAAFGPQYAPYFLSGRRYYDDPEALPLSEVQKMSATSSAVKLALSELGPDDARQRLVPKKKPVKTASKKRKPKRKGS